MIRTKVLAVEPASPPPMMVMSVYRMAQISAEGGRLTSQQEKAFSRDNKNIFLPGKIRLLD
jgi:hypothetical protein